MRFKIMENKINNERCYVVYKHTSPNNKIYIGITGQIPPEKRWANGRGYTQNEYFNKEIILYGWDNFIHEILFDNLTRVEAQQKEAELIKYYKSTDRNFGYNVSSGGYKKITDEIRMSAYGSGKSFEPIMQYTCLGIFIKTFDNALIAEYETGVNHSNIISCCEGHLRSAGKFVWRYANPALNLIDYNYKINKRVVQYTRDGLFVKVYNSIRMAAKETDIDQSSITKCCKEKLRTAGNFIWRYATDIPDSSNSISPIFHTPSLSEAV